MLGGCFRKLFGLALLLVIVGLAWVYRSRITTVWDEIGDRWSRRAAETSASPALADTAQQKLNELANGRRDRVALGSAELQSLLLFRYREALPAFVDSPSVRIVGDRAHLHVRIPTDRFLGRGDLDEIAALLPDTTSLGVRGQLLPAAEGEVAFAVDEITAHRIPLPRRVVPTALELLGRKEERGLPPDAISLPLPRGARAAYLWADSLVILSSAGRRD